MFLEIFDNPKPILAMLHLKGDTLEEILERVVIEADIYHQCGVDAMIVEDYFGDVTAVIKSLELLKNERPDYCLGVNVLDDFPKSYELCQQFDLPFMQVDSICGHLNEADEKDYLRMVDRYREESEVAVIGGVRFKYQPVLSNRSLEEDLKIGMAHCDAIAVTGSGTGVETSTDKIKAFRAIIGAFPLVVAAGVTLETLEEKLSIGDAAIVGSTFKDTRKDTGDVFQPHVCEFMSEVKRLFRGG
jgi:predicted TIM-barrel enzyme